MPTVCPHPVDLVGLLVTVLDELARRLLDLHDAVLVVGELLEKSVADR